MSVEIQNVDLAAGTLDIYMTNTAGCSFCNDPLFDNRKDCESYGSSDGGITYDGVWTFDASMSQSECCEAHPEDLVGVCADSGMQLDCPDGVCDAWFDGAVKGFEFRFVGMTITGVSGGTAGEHFNYVNFDLGYTGATYDSKIVGLSTDGISVIPAGSAVLTNVAFSDFGEGICFLISNDNDCSLEGTQDGLCDHLVSDSIGLSVNPDLGGCFCVADTEVDAYGNVIGDGVCDADDNCPAVVNPNQLDTDGDDIGDACDYYYYDANNDQDADGIPECTLSQFECNAITDVQNDNCPTVANADQMNTDGDTFGDACDVCVNDANNDLDGDGVCYCTLADCSEVTNIDNCTLSNPDQADGDGDGVGDICDNCSSVQNPPTDCDGSAATPDQQCDADLDGVGDVCDNCVANINYGQADSDFDFVGDACDNCSDVANADQADSDFDFVGDVCDACLGFDDFEDTDSDGVPNGCDACADTAAGETVDETGCGDVSLEAILSFGEIDLASQTIEIHLENSAPVSGFQFLLSSDDSVDFVDAYGGSSEENGFTVELGDNNIVLGFSLSATEIPTGNDILTYIEFDGFTSNEICLSEGVITSGYEDAQYLDVSYGDCISLYSKGDVNMDGVLDVLDIVTIVNIIFETIDPDDYQLWASDYNSDGYINIMDIVQIVNAIFSDDVIIEGCISSYACNYDENATVDDGSCYYADENYDCDGNCIAEFDCAGVCGGSAELDECGICGGDNSTCTDCNDEIDGVAYIDGCGDCVGGNTGNDACPYDCEGELGGTSFVDNCGECVPAGDTTCVQGCDGIWKNDGTQMQNDECGVCGGDGSSCEPSLCDGLTEVELWGEYYDIEETTGLSISGNPGNGWDGGLTGSIPPEIGCLTNLTSLYIIHNQLTGEIPSEIGNLTNLTTLGLGWNQLTGSIPPEIGQLTNLIYWHLGWNQLIGEIPSEVCDLIESNNLNMTYILEGNNLINTCEETSLCDGLTEVELWGEWYDIGATTSIDLYNQGLSGSIPPEIGCLTNLTSLNLYNNELTGLIPPEIGNLTNLTWLDLSSNNQLTGEIPSTIGNLTNLYYLALYNNQLTGEIPSEVCDLLESNNIDMNWILWGNNLINTCEEEPSICDGLIEVGFETLEWGYWWYDIATTTTINLSSMGLSGSIPPETGCLTNLTWLDLSSNNLTGEIPSEIGNLTYLTYLNLWGNQLSGEIPPEVCDLIESNNLSIDGILYENNLINTCD